MSPASTAKSPEQPGRSPRVQMDLRVFSGMHAGAEVRLPERGILMIGQADDCDLIISDAGIAPHHCVLTVVGDQVLLRTLEGRVEIEGGDWSSNSNTALEHFVMVHLGDVKLAVGPHWSERWQQLAGPEGVADTEAQLARRRQRVLLTAGLLLVVALLVLFGGWRLMRQPASTGHGVDKHLVEMRGILKSMSLSHVKASQDTDGTLILRGVVDTQGQLPKLKQRIANAGLTVEMHVRDWPEVAREVRRIFALYHHTVRTQMVGNGPGIQVGGHFGGADLSKIESTIYSSKDMQRLDKNTLHELRVSLVDYDARPKPPPKPDPNKAISRLVVGKDMAYVITRDGSRYYPGSLLPQGGKFIAAYPDGTIVLKRHDKYMQLTKDTRYRAPQPLDTHAGHPVVAPAASIPAAISQTDSLSGAASAKKSAKSQPVPVSSELDGKSSHVH